MPTLGGLIQSGDSAQGTTPIGVYVEAAPDSVTPSTFIVPLVPDATSFPDEAQVEQETLRDFTEGQDWLCKRIVGKLQLGIKNQAPVLPGTTWKMVTLGAAFFVARAKDTNSDLPDLDGIEYNVLNSENVRNPWMWRRVWTLSNGVAPVTSVPDSGHLTVDLVWNLGFRTTTAEQASALDSAHIDCKSARRIRREERLWFALSAQGWNSTYGLDNQSVTNPECSGVAGLLDYRILGAMRRSNNRSTF